MFRLCSRYARPVIKGEAYGNEGARFMGYRVTEFETTPNPNAVKCWLDGAISTLD